MERHPTVAAGHGDDVAAALTAVWRGADERREREQRGVEGSSHVDVGVAET